MLRLADFEAELVVDRGVFSSGGIDPGTLELLRSGAGGEPGGQRAGQALLDLGCGYGPIAVTLAHRYPGATVWAVEVNTRALELTAVNAARHELSTRVRPVTPEQVPGDVSFAGIWSNPPIRIGKDALHELLRTWLPRLTPDGSAWLVVHKHLGGDSLASWLDREGWQVRRTGSRKGYRLLEIRRTLEIRPETAT